MKALGATLALLLGACSGPVWMPSAAVPMEGARPDLSGVWRGMYESRDTGRFGDIVFALSADGDSAVGEVVMVPHGRAVTVVGEVTPWRWTGVTRPEVLTVRFVRVSADGLVGELDPYRDPDCGCELRTVFDGGIEGDLITGQFETLAEAGHEAEGIWWVRRQPEPP